MEGSRATSREAWCSNTEEINMKIEELMAYYYPMDNMIKKDGTFDPGAYGSGTMWEPIFGAKVWSWLNEEQNIFALLPKEPWGKSGWRVKTTRGHSTGGGIANQTDATVPTAQSSTYYQMYAEAKTMAHMDEVGELAEAVSSGDDAINMLPQHREDLAFDHQFCINYQLGVLMETAAASNNFESIDRIVHSAAEIDNDGGIDGSTVGLLYSTQYDIDSATTWDSQVSENSGTDRDLTLTLIDTVYEAVLNAGGDPKVLLTGTETLFRWEQLLEAERRYVNTATVVPTFGGVRGVKPGVEAGFMVSTYHGTPIITSQHVKDRDTIEPIYFLDTDYLKFATLKPTTYSETGANDFVKIGYFKYRMMFKTVGEVRCYNFAFQGKLTNLK